MNYWVTCLGIGTKECQECSIRGVSQGECKKKEQMEGKRETYVFAIVIFALIIKEEIKE